MKFNELGLSENLLKSIERSGFDEPTAIQAQTIPLLLKGEDVIGQAQTGTGKTAAFSLPIIEKIDTNNPNIQALVISPTRELAIQTQKEMERLGKDQGVKAQVVYGGSDIKKQIYDLKKKPQIMVGTPGRLLDHINRRTIKLEHVDFLVLDEADEMLNMGFLEDIENIIKKTPETRQTLLYSATMPAPIKRVGVQFMKDPKQITVKAKELTTDLIEQYYVKVKDSEKFEIMTRIFDVQMPEVTIIFCRTKRRVDEVAKGLSMCGYRAAGLHGDLTQARRSQIMKDFKNNRINYLVATDVAARGIDVSGVTHVYNFDIPQDPESYVHRIGRTGRAGKRGTSVTFVSPNEMSYLREVEKMTKVRMLPLKPPSKEESLEGQLKFAEADVAKLVQKTEKEIFIPTAKKLLEEYDVEDLVAALLKTMTKEQVKVHITPEKPLKNNNKKGGNYRGKGNGRGGRGGYNRNRRDRDGGGKKRYSDNKKRPSNNRNRDNSDRNRSKSNSSKGKSSFVIKNKE